MKALSKIELKNKLKSYDEKIIDMLYERKSMYKLCNDQYGEEYALTIRSKGQYFQLVELANSLNIKYK